MTHVTAQYENLPRFPDGRIDYTNSNSAPIISCIVEHEGMILLVKRSGKVSHYKNKWDVITGYIDDPKLSAEEQSLLELEEELGLTKECIMNVKLGEVIELVDTTLKKKWMMYPAVVTLNTIPEIKLNHENVDFAWVYPKDIATYDIVPDLVDLIKRTYG